MSEDDNTNGADDSAYASNTITNDDLNVSVPTSSSLCHNITTISDSSDLATSPPSTASISSPPVVTFTSVQIRASNAATGVDHPIEGSGPSPHAETIVKSNESCFDPVVSSTNMIENERLRTPESDTSNTTASLRIVTPPSEYDQQPTDLSMNNASSSASSSPYVHVVSMPAEKIAEPATSAPDTSGLQLLSNSILAYEKNTFISIKQEPIERSPLPSSGSMYDNASMVECRRQSTAAETGNGAFDASSELQAPAPKPYAAAVTEPLGGLNLLCALAEQRFQEEVGGSGHRSDRKRSSSSEESEPKRAKKHKEKHASKKAKKKERKEKKRRSSGASPINSSAIVEKDFKETFDRVKAKYAKCDCRKASGDGAADECCCRGSNWLTPEQMYSAMKSEYRDRLAEIAREFQEKKRKLDAMNSKEMRLQRESTPSSSKSGGSSSKLSTFSPSILSTSSLECNQSSGIDFTSNGKAPSDSESCSSTSSKRKHFSGAKQTLLDSDVQVKRQKSLVGYIFASKKRHNESNSFSTTDEASLNSDNSRTAPVTTTTAPTALQIKQEVFEFDESSTPPEINLFGDSPHHFPRKPLTLAETMVKNQKLGKHTLAKHHKKIKNGKEHKHHRRSTESRERKRRISNRCTLTEQNLDALIDGKKIRVLTAMGGLFYAGCLNAVQPPDVYAVVLDGERGSRPHIMSREEILRDAVSNLVSH